MKTKNKTKQLVHSSEKKDSRISRTAYKKRKDSRLEELEDLDDDEVDIYNRFLKNKR